MPVGKLLYLGDGAIGDPWDGEKVVVLEPDIESDELISELARHRYGVETAGADFVLSGGEAVRIQTDRESRATLTAIFLQIDKALRPEHAPYKFPGGQVRPVSNADMTAAILAAETHVQRCFVAEMQVQGLIDDGSLET